MRVIQPAGQKGSLKWIQRAVNERWPSLEEPILSRLGGDHAITWTSPLIDDQFAEYRDASFLRKIGRPDLLSDLSDFWPARGPQWDALGVTSAGDALILEAKAHVAELCSSGTGAGDASRIKIEATLEAVAKRLGARPERAPWATHFYQLANRLAHLEFLRSRGVPAWLVLVNFVGDADVGGPSSSEAWQTAYQVAFHVMGLSQAHKLSRHIIHVPIDVRSIAHVASDPN